MGIVKNMSMVPVGSDLQGLAVQAKQRQEGCRKATNQSSGTAKQLAETGHQHFFIPVLEILIPHRG